MHKYRLQTLLYLSLLCSPICGYELISFNHLDRVENEIFFITPFRSGTNLALCSLQLLTSKPIRWFNYSRLKKTGGEGTNRLNLKIDNSKKPLYRNHFVTHLDEVDALKNKLIMVIRNPKEVILRYCEDNLIDFKKYLSNTAMHFKYISSDKSFNYYLRLLRFYEQWEGEKYLVYYEDLLLHPQVVLKELLEFMQEGDERLEDYLENMDEYRARMLDSYSKQHKDTGGGVSKGKDILYHSKKVPVEYLQKADRILQAKAPDLWEKYLFRYETTDVKD